MRDKLIGLSGIPEKVFYIWALFSGLTWATNITAFMLWLVIIGSFAVSIAYKDGEDVTAVFENDSVPSVVRTFKRILWFAVITALAAQGWFFTAMFYTITGIFMYAICTEHEEKIKAEEAKDETDRSS